MNVLKATTKRDGVSSFARAAITSLALLHFAGTASAQDWMEGITFPLDDDVAAFVEKNPRLKNNSPASSEQLIQEAKSFLILGNITIKALELCDERWSNFPGYVDEARRRVDLMRRVFMQVGGITPEEMAPIMEQADQAFTNTQVSDQVLANLDMLFQLCETSLYEISAGFDFGQ